VEKIIQSVDLFFPVRLIVSLIVYQHVNYFFRYSALHLCCAVTSSGKNLCDVTGTVEFVVIRTTKARECPYVILLPFGL